MRHPPAGAHGIQSRALQSRAEGAGWRVVDGLGPRGAAIALLPQRDVPTPGLVIQRITVVQATD